MKIAKILGLCLLSCIFSACPEQSEKYITLVNKSERDIVYQKYRDRNLQLQTHCFYVQLELLEFLRVRHLL